jgi:hypothetical protein
MISHLLSQAGLLIIKKLEPKFFEFKNYFLKKEIHLETSNKLSDPFSTPK